MTNALPKAAGPLSFPSQTFRFRDHGQSYTDERPDDGTPEADRGCKENTLPSPASHDQAGPLTVLPGCGNDTRSGAKLTLIGQPNTKRPAG